MNAEWDITKRILDIEAAKEDAVIARRLKELGWQYVPEGYVLVPVEPTEKMVEAGIMFHSQFDSSVPRVYKAMIQETQEQE